MHNAASISEVIPSFSWQSSAGLMPDGINNLLSVVVWSGLLEWDASIQMLQASLKTLFMRQASALQSTLQSSRPNIGKQRDVKDIFCAMPQRL